MRRRAEPPAEQAGHATSRLAMVLVIAIAGCTGVAPSPSAPPSSVPASAPAPASPSAPSALPSASQPSALPSARSIPPGTGEIVLAKSDVAREETSPADAKAAGGAVTAFGLDLYREFVTPDENAVISPASIAVALGMARVGARGETAAEMDEVLNEVASDDHASWLNALERALADRTESFPAAEGEPQKVTLRIANTQFAQAGLPIEQAFLDALASRYGVGMNLVDYINDHQGARRLINAWVSERTERRITDLLGERDITPDTRLTLVNAIYLKAPWERPFAADATEDGSFRRRDGSRITVPMMRLDTADPGVQPRAATSDRWQAVELPYRGRKLAMLVVVPDDLEAFEEALTPAELARIDAALEVRSVDLTMPRFSTESHANLNELLKGLGMTRAFDVDDADFSGITRSTRLYISGVIHQANIDVDEKGTEAAAATAVVFGDTAGGEAPEPLVIRVDRPFMFALRDVPTGAILFLGRIADPSVGR